MSALSLATGGVFLFLLAHGEALFAELSSMQPSASSLERSPKGLSARWEAHLRTFENVPSAAPTLVISLSGQVEPGGTHRCGTRLRLCRKITLPFRSMLTSRRLPASVQPKTSLAGQAHESQKETFNSQMHLYNLSSSSPQRRCQRAPCDQPRVGCAT